MEIKQHRGRLIRWNDARWFGFIQAQGLERDVFIHISAFSKLPGRRPRVGDTILFDINADDEAIYHLRHCPGTKMDGDRDGIPCERQWCGR